MINVKFYAAIYNIFKTLVVNTQTVRREKKAYPIFFVLIKMGAEENTVNSEEY